MIIKHVYHVQVITIEAIISRSTPDIFCIIMHLLFVDTAVRTFLTLECDT